MRRIYRYELNLNDKPAVQMPVGAEILSVSTVRGQLECWAVVDPVAVAGATELRQFHVVGTGHPLPDDCGRFISTVMIADNRLVFHIFEVAE